MIMTTDGKECFPIPQCTCCIMDTAGNHASDCPCNPYTIIYVENLYGKTKLD